MQVVFRLHFRYCWVMLFRASIWDRMTEPTTTNARVSLLSNEIDDAFSATNLYKTQISSRASMLSVD